MEIPDGFWWNIGNKNYARVGGVSVDGLHCGGSSLLLNDPASDKGWTLGGTPDGLWYTEQDRAYGRSGGTTSFDKCGSSYLTLTGTTVDGGWGLGATPDALWWNNTALRRYLLLGSTTQSTKSAGASSFNLDSTAAYGSWSRGAPDALSWHQIGRKYYLMGGSNQNLYGNCGYEASMLYFESGSLYAVFGAKYTPDALMCDNNIMKRRRIMMLVGCSCSQNARELAGCFAFHSYDVPSHFFWDIGEFG